MDKKVSTVDNAKAGAIADAIAKIEKQYGKGAVMKMGDQNAKMNVEVIPTTPARAFSPCPICNRAAARLKAEFRVKPFSKGLREFESRALKIFLCLQACLQAL